MERQTVKIPKERVAVLIGKKGETKQKIEELTQSKIEVASGSGDVEITAQKDANPVSALKAYSIVKAVGRGFSPERALQLLDDAFFLEIMDLVELLGKQSGRMESRKGRVIGKEGSTRDKIEEETETFISVYGKTVAFIGKPEDIATAKEAVQMLLEGAQHQKVYDFLARKARASKKFEL
jgi:ribosomal RNA assembly protein